MTRINTESTKYEGISFVVIAHMTTCEQGTLLAGWIMWDLVFKYLETTMYVKCHRIRFAYNLTIAWVCNSLC